MNLAQEQTISEETPWAAIAGVIATVSVFAIAQGLSYPLLSFILQRQGVSPGMIGLSAAMTPIGFIVSSPLIPGVSRWFGAGRTALSCAALSALLLALIGWTQDVYAWFLLRFLLGVAVNPLYVLSEVWMIALAPPARRGRIMGIYTTLISAGFAAGPLCLLFVGSEGWPPFLVGIVGLLICGVCLGAVLHRLPDMNGGGSHHVSVFGFIPLAWLLLFAVVVAAGFEQGILALLPVYGTSYGITESAMSALLTVMIAGNIALQVPLGLLAERWSARVMRLGCVTADRTWLRGSPSPYRIAAGLALHLRLGRGLLRHLHHDHHRARRAVFRLHARRRQCRLRYDVGCRRHRRAACRGCRDGSFRRARPAAGARRHLPSARHAQHRALARRLKRAPKPAMFDTYLLGQLDSWLRR